MEFREANLLKAKKEADEEMKVSSLDEDDGERIKSATSGKGKEVLAAAVGSTQPSPPERERAMSRTRSISDLAASSLDNHGGLGFTRKHFSAYNRSGTVPYTLHRPTVSSLHRMASLPTQGTLRWERCTSTK